LAKLYGVSSDEFYEILEGGVEMRDAKFIASL